MTRVSTAEMYDDKDVITQICKLKDGLNSALGGIIADIDIVNDELVIDWADGESIALPLPSPTGISSIAGSVSGGNLTMTIYMTNGSSHAFTCPLNGMASETYVNTLDAQNVKLTGAQSVAGVKTFTDSPLVPVTPSGPTAAICDAYANNATDGVNNIMHKTGDETVNGIKTMLAPIVMKANPIIRLPDNTPWSRDTTPSGVIARDIRVLDSDGNDFMQLRFRVGTDNKRSIRALIWNPTTQLFDTITLAETTP